MMGFYRRALLQAARIYLRIPLISGLAVVSLALGICIATTVFSLVDVILLRPLPFHKPDNVVLVWRLAPSGMTLGDAEYPWGLREFTVLKTQISSFQAVSAFKGGTFVLTNAGDPVTLEGLKATPMFFSVFDTKPLLGRGFSLTQPSADEVVLSYDLWQKRFAGSERIVGTPIDLNGHPYTIVGIMPKAFQVPEASTMPASFILPARPELWVSLPTQPVPSSPGGLDDLIIVARLKYDNSLSQAQQELNLFATSQNRAFPAFSGWFTSRLTSYYNQVSGKVRTPLLLVQLAVLMVVVICCVNVANLLLVLSFSRRSEFSVRSALGATLIHIVKQILVESSLLSIAAGILGALFSLGTIVAVHHLAPPQLPRLGEGAIDYRLLLFAFITTVACGFATGVLPALWAIKGDIFSSLKEGQRTSGHKSDRTRDMLMGAQIALALLLVIATGLLVRSVTRLARVDPGFVPNQRVSFKVYLPGLKYPTQDAETTALHELENRFQSLPGVRAAGTVSSVPLGEIPPELTTVRFLDRPPVPERERPFVNYSIISPSYFRSAGIPFVRGRPFSNQDSSTAPRVVIINETMAHRFWPNGDPIGKSFDYGASQIPAMSIVGIARDVKHKSLREDGVPEIYVPYTQHPWSSMQNMQFIVNINPLMHLGEYSFSRALHSFDSSLSIDKYTEWPQLVSDSMKELRFAAFVISAFGFLSLILASIGIYGVIAFAVQRRTREIGIRMALGSQRSDIFMLILRYGVTIAACGAGVGLLIAVGAAVMLRHYLFGISAWDPLSFIIGLLLLVLVTVGACCIPARRAMALEPMNALRRQ